MISESATWSGQATKAPSKAALSSSTAPRIITPASTIPRSRIDADCILVIRYCGPIGYPGSAEVVNMLPPDSLVRAGVAELPCIGDGRQSGTSGSPSILNASPEAAIGGGLALLRTGDRIRVDLNRRSRQYLDFGRRAGASAAANLSSRSLSDQTPWQELYREHVGQLATGAVLENAVEYQRVAERFGVPRDNH